MSEAEFFAGALAAAFISGFGFGWVAARTLAWRQRRRVRP
jgi:hypothetical protein